MTSEIPLTPAELKRQGIIDTATALFRELLGTHVDQACLDASEAFQTDTDAPAPEVKVGFSVAFDPLAASPEVTVKIAWSAKRSDEASATVNDTQTKIEFPAPAEVVVAKSETPGAWLRNAKKKEGAR